VTLRSQPLKLRGCEWVTPVLALKPASLRDAGFAAHCDSVAAAALAAAAVPAAPFAATLATASVAAASVSAGLTRGAGMRLLLAQLWLCEDP